jgi:uncharacterized protein YndB with AHSA1/START domain
MSTFIPNPTLDLVLERTIAVSPERVWAAWTEPELMLQWFTPAPWKTVAVDVDLRPGGRCITTMESPEGDQYPNSGCYLQVEPNRLLVFTSVMTPMELATSASPLASKSSPPPTAAPTTGRLPCTPARRTPSSTKTWVSPTDGARPSTNLSP